MADVKVAFDGWNSSSHGWGDGTWGNGEAVPGATGAVGTVTVNGDTNVSVTGVAGTGTLGTVSSLQWYEFRAETGGILESESHGSGSLENLTLFSGKLKVVSGTESRELNSGETLRFLTDSPHILHNQDKEPAHGFMVNLLNNHESY